MDTPEMAMALERFARYLGSRRILELKLAKESAIPERGKVGKEGDVKAASRRNLFSAGGFFVPFDAKDKKVF